MVFEDASICLKIGFKCYKHLFYVQLRDNFIICTLIMPNVQSVFLKKMRQ